MRLRLPRSFQAALSTLALLLAATGCQPDTFDAHVAGETTVKGDALGALLSTFPIGSFNALDFDANQDFKNQGVSKDQVSSVKVDSIKLRITSPADQDFSFLESLAFYARTGEREVLIADKTAIQTLNLPPPNPTLTMDVKGEELAPFITAPSMSITVRGKGHAPSRDTTLQATVTLKVGVKLF